MAHEVFQPLFHLQPSSPEPEPVSFLELCYDRPVVTGSMSKANGLAGTRVSWIATKSPEIMSACVRIRDYSNISVSQIDALIAAGALNERCRLPILAENIKLAAKNLKIMGRFINKTAKLCQWSKPTAGTTTLLRFSNGDGEHVDDVEFCLKLQEKTGVMLAPVSLCFSDGDRSNFKGYCRVQFLVDTEGLQNALEELEAFLGSYLNDIPLAR